MTRPLRIELAGGLYHVTARGDRREPIYSDDRDREAWLDIIADVCDRFNWVSHGWCQMTNHYHLIVETPEANLSQGMRHLNGVYTQWFNRTHGKTGHVFQGRYKAVLVEKETHLTELARYVVLNPVRAGMVGQAGAWPWSSYNAMIGVTPPPRWLQISWLLRMFAEDRTDAIHAYIDFVRAGVGLPSIWAGLRGQLFLGTDAFVDRMQAATQALGQDIVSEIPRCHRRPKALPLTQYQAQFTRAAEAMAAAYATGDYSMKEIAEHFTVHYSTVSRAVAKFRKGAIA